MRLSSPTLVPRWSALLVLSAGLALAEVRDVAPATAVPHRGDHTLLTWREGPPYFTGARYSPERSILRVETGRYAADFDTERIAVTGFARFAEPRDEGAAARSALAAEPLPPARLHLAVRVGDTVYAGTGRGELALDAHGLPATPLQFPVRVIESGRFFQKFALHDLEFRDPAGRRLNAAARLEIACWPDRIALTLVVRPEGRLEAARAFLRLETAGGMDASLAEIPQVWEDAADHRATLTLSADGAAVAPSPPAEVSVAVAPTDSRGRAAVRWNSEELCHSIRLTAPPWPASREGNYPEAMLDAWETYEVTVENRSAVPQQIALKFEHTPVKAITGFVPMLLDREDRPLGIPVQISKNWHVARDGTELPHAGQWIHGRTSLWVAPNSRVTLRYGTTYARWGGLPTASLAQLSLVGWGHNGFWDQMALGAFGESICFQPARVMRRALLTDFRPLFQRGFARDERWAWTTNVGGGDTMVRLDSAGRYVPFKRNVTRYESHGPNLAHLAYEELSEDGAVRSRVEVLLPQAEDVVRVYLRVSYEVLRRTEFSRLALLQLGADYYNDSDSPLVAWGDAAGLTAEHRPRPEAGVRVVPPWEARGEQPWISLHGNVRADRERNGQASRGLVVREWRAVLGGRPVPAPYFAVVGSRSARTRLGAEIVPPPGVNALEAGDRVEMLVEWLALPLNADRYYGPDDGFRAALAAGANTWRMVHREAAGHRPRVQLADGSDASGWPLTVPVGAGREVSFTASGGLGWYPVRFSGLTSPDGIELWRETRTGPQRVGPAALGGTYWQTDYESATRRWRVTCTLPATPASNSYRLIVRETQASPTADRSNLVPTLTR